MIPEEKKAAVEHALQTAFGVTEIDDIRELTVGLSSALILRIVVKGSLICSVLLCAPMQWATQRTIIIV